MDRIYWLALADQRLGKRVKWESSGPSGSVLKLEGFVEAYHMRVSLHMETKVYLEIEGFHKPIAITECTPLDN